MIGTQIKKANKIPFIQAVRIALGLTSAMIYNDIRWKYKKGEPRVRIGRALKVQLHDWIPTLQEIRNLEEILVNYNCKLVSHGVPTSKSYRGILRSYRFKLEFIDKNL